VIPHNITGKKKITPEIELGTIKTF